MPGQKQPRLESPFVNAMCPVIPFEHAAALLGVATFDQNAHHRLLAGSAADRRSAASAQNSPYPLSSKAHKKARTV